MIDIGETTKWESESCKRSGDGLGYWGALLGSSEKERTVNGPKDRSGQFSFSTEIACRPSHDRRARQRVRIDVPNFILFYEPSTASVVVGHGGVAEHVRQVWYVTERLEEEKGFSWLR